ncbi:MAG TPA: hypothetical protein PK296_05670, partial [Paludibacteraceae bacterium]|nr:hypothetical protein [Paludibacteraceae bacterium]
MKKRTIWILIISMVVTFVGLILLQIRYVKINAEMIENQFDENVQRSLFQTVRLVEENEALQYLGQILDEPNYKTEENNKKLNFTNNRLQLKDKETNLTQNSKSVEESKELAKIQLSTRQGKSTIEETSRELQKKFLEKFSRSRTILDQAVFRWLKEAENKDISERVNFDELNGILENILNNNGVNLPFNYSIVDK